MGEVISKRTHRKMSNREPKYTFEKASHMRFLTAESSPRWVARQAVDTPRIVGDERIRNGIREFGENTGVGPRRISRGIRSGEVDRIGTNLEDFHPSSTVRCYKNASQMHHASDDEVYFNNKTAPAGDESITA